MRLADVPMPRPTGDAALVRVEAAGLNFLDTLVVRGQYQVKPPLPFSPGVEVAGTVTAVGPDSPYQVGERIAAPCDFGGFAEFAIARREGSQRLPPDMPARDGVAMLTTYPTAHLALRKRGQMKAGDLVLVTAAAGGVGSATVQLAKQWGAKVIAAVGSADKAAVCKELGADFVIDYGIEKIVEAVRQIAAAEHVDGVDVAVDSVGGATAIDCLRVLGWQGRLMIVGFAGGSIAELPSNRLLLKNAAAMGVYWGEERRRDPALAETIFKEIFAIYRAGRFRPLVRDVFKFGEAAAALAALASRRSVGKVVIES
ncbi:MAG TPA: NADPH:quinone oxidoreductase family protein [Stellaceae bacterium]|nr:NADPH:quinone oxidoreductase family protein [Stellaceae bacterium]